MNPNINFIFQSSHVDVFDFHCQEYFQFPWEFYGEKNGNKEYLVSVYDQEVFLKKGDYLVILSFVDSQFIDALEPVKKYVIFGLEPSMANNYISCVDMLNNEDVSLSDAFDGFGSDLEPSDDEILNIEFHLDEYINGWDIDEDEFDEEDEGYYN